MTDLDPYSVVMIFWISPSPESSSFESGENGSNQFAEWCGVDGFVTLLLTMEYIMVVHSSTWQRNALRLFKIVEKPFDCCGRCSELFYFNVLFYVLCLPINWMSRAPAVVLIGTGGDSVWLRLLLWRRGSNRNHRIRRLKCCLLRDKCGLYNCSALTRNAGLNRHVNHDSLVILNKH